MAGRAADSDIQVLEFYLDDREYCVDIAYVDEIIGMEEVTPLPNAEPHVEGVMNLRGITTKIVNPKRVLGLNGTVTGNRVIVFRPRVDADQTTGWVVDEVDEVSRIDVEDVDESVDDDQVTALVKRDDGFVIWLSPDTITA